MCIVQLAMPVLLLICLAVRGPGFADSGPIGEISNIHTEHATLTTVDIVGDTIHPSTSQVALGDEPGLST